MNIFCFIDSCDSVGYMLLMWPRTNSNNELLAIIVIVAVCTYTNTHRSTNTLPIHGIYESVKKVSVYVILHDAMYILAEEC